MVLLSTFEHKIIKVMAIDTTQSTVKAVPYSKRWSALFLLCTAQFMVIMDTSIIGVALPAIKSDLGYSQTNLQWKHR